MLTVEREKKNFLLPSSAQFFSSVVESKVGSSEAAFPIAGVYSRSNKNSVPNYFGFGNLNSNRKDGCPRGKYHRDWNPPAPRLTTPIKFIGQNHNAECTKISKAIEVGVVGLIRRRSCHLATRFDGCRNFRQLRVLEGGFHSYAAGPIKTSFDFVKIHFESVLLLAVERR